MVGRVLVLVVMRRAVDRDFFVEEVVGNLVLLTHKPQVSGQLLRFCVALQRLGSLDNLNGHNILLSLHCCCDRVVAFKLSHTPQYL